MIWTGFRTIRCFTYAVADADNYPPCCAYPCIIVVRALAPNAYEARADLGDNRARLRAVRRHCTVRLAAQHPVAASDCVHIVGRHDDGARCARGDYASRNGQCSAIGHQKFSAVRHWVKETFGQDGPCCGQLNIARRGGFSHVW